MFFIVKRESVCCPLLACTRCNQISSLAAPAVCRRYALQRVELGEESSRPGPARSPGSNSAIRVQWRSAAPLFSSVTHHLHSPSMQICPLIDFFNPFVLNSPLAVVLLLCPSRPSILSSWWRDVNCCTINWWRGDSGALPQQILFTKISAPISWGWSLFYPAFSFFSLQSVRICFIFMTLVCKEKFHDVREVMIYLTFA